VASGNVFNVEGCMKHFLRKGMGKATQKKKAKDEFQIPTLGRRKHGPLGGLSRQLFKLLENKLDKSDNT
jgi:hypothetical protein